MERYQDYEKRIKKEALHLVQVGAERGLTVAEFKTACDWAKDAAEQQTRLSVQSGNSSSGSLE